MDPVQPDPTFKQTIKDMLYGHLYNPVNEQFTERLKEIVRQHCQMMHATQPYFLYRGKLYTSDRTVKRTERVRHLARALEPQMSEYLADLKDLTDYEIPMVLGFFNNMLNSTSEVQDYLRILPEAVHTPLLEYLLDHPGTTTSLTDEQVAEIQAKNAVPIGLLKGRLFLTLLF